MSITINGAGIVSSDGVIAVNVNTISELSSVNVSIQQQVVVGDLARGGIFDYDASKSAVNDDGVIFGGWVRQFSGPVNVKWFGAVGDGVTNDAASLQNVVDYTVNRDGVGFSSIACSAGAEYIVETEVLLDKKATVFKGNNSVFRWDGAADGDIFRIIDSTACSFKNIVMLGNNTSIPRSAFHLESPLPSGVLGTNEATVIENISIGRYFGQSDTQLSFKNGILIDGELDGNNDQFTIRNVRIHECTEYGIYVPNTQSIWSQIENCLINACPVGILVGGDMNIINPQFNRNTIHDIQGVRYQSIRITNLQSEHSAGCIRSDFGASFNIYGGKILRSSVIPNYNIYHGNGGNLLVENLSTNNLEVGVIDKIYYLGSTLNKAKISIKNCDISNSDIRNMWEINSGGTVATIDKIVEIDIDTVGFKLQTTVPYTDDELDIPSIATDSFVLIPGQVSAIQVGDFYNVSYGGDLQKLHLCHNITSDAVNRMYLANFEATAIDLPSGRFRSLGLNDKINIRSSEAVTPALMTTLTGQLIQVSLIGARLGDFITWSVDQGWANTFVSAYVSAPDVVQIQMFNASGGPSAPAAGIANVGVVKKFGRIITNVLYSPALIADLANTSIEVSVIGARLGGHVFVSYIADQQGLIVTANISADDVVTISISNRTGAGVTLAAGNFNIMVM